MNYFFAALLILLPSCRDDSEGTTGARPNSTKERYWYSCSVGDNRYFFTLTEDAFRNMPTWNLSSEVPPPVSAKEAFDLADARLAKIEIPDNYFWDLESIGLTPVGGGNPKETKFLWEVHYRYLLKGFSTGIHPKMTFAITMDGELIEPEVRRIPPRENQEAEQDMRDDAR
jgi:hypothetical protein